MPLPHKMVLSGYIGSDSRGKSFLKLKRYKKMKKLKLDENSSPRPYRLYSALSQATTNPFNTYFVVKKIKGSSILIGNKSRKSEIDLHVHRGERLLEDLIQTTRGTGGRNSLQMPEKTVFLLVRLPLAFSIFQGYDPGGSEDGPVHRKDMLQYKKGQGMHR